MSAEDATVMPIEGKRTEPIYSCIPGPDVHVPLPNSGPLQ
jgi:hypothetical protein